MSVDEKFLDWFTNIDNLISISMKNQVDAINRLTEAQIATNQLLNRQNLLLEELASKPTILQAPQLETIIVNQESQGLSIPENIDIAPQLYYDVEGNKAYARFNSALISNRIGPLATGAEWDSTELTVKGLFESIVSTFGIKATGFDLVRMVLLKSVAYNILTASLPGRVIYEIYKNKKKIWYENVLDVSEPLDTDRSDDSYYFRPKDTVQQVITNSSGNTVTVIQKAYYLFYREISLDEFHGYIDKLRKLF